MNKQLIKTTGVLIALFTLAALPLYAATNTVLLSYSTNVVEFTVEDGVWTYEGDFAHRDNNYGGKRTAFKGLTSDGLRVFIGESSGVDSRILEFDMEGNYQRVLTKVGYSIDHMSMSHDGKWVYANVNAWVPEAAVYRYSATTGSGGKFISNKGTNELGNVLWEFKVPRGITPDDKGNLWVSDRTAGKVFKFRESDGTYLGVVTGLSNVQALYYNADDEKIYCTGLLNASYVIDTADMTSRSVTFVPGTNTRLGITKVADDFCSCNFDIGVISTFDFDAATSTVVYTVPIHGNELITLPKTPLRPKQGELLLSETLSNRVMRISFDTGNMHDVEDKLFAGGEGVTYNGIALRQPRGLANYSNYVYVAEGVAGGRILKFSKWGIFKSVALDFSQTAYADCVPAALALTPDGKSIYVTDAHMLYIESDGTEWSNTMPAGYLNTNTYGRTVYKFNLTDQAVSVFADDSNLPSNYQLIEPRGVAVDNHGNVYFTSWYNYSNTLYKATGRTYYYNSDGVVQGNFEIQNTSLCYYDPIGIYDPLPGDSSISGAGIITSGYGIADIFWSPEKTAPASDYKKIIDNDFWRIYIDAEVINGELFYTDPVFKTLWSRTGDAARRAELTNLVSPTYMTFVAVSGEEPPTPGTKLLLR